MVKLKSTIFEMQEAAKYLDKLAFDFCALGATVFVPKNKHIQVIHIWKNRKHITVGYNEKYQAFYLQIDICPLANNGSTLIIDTLYQNLTNNEFIGYTMYDIITQMRLFWSSEEYYFKLKSKHLKKYTP